MEKPGLWWQEGQVTCEQAVGEYVCPAVLCLSCQTVNLLLQLSRASLWCPSVSTGHGLRPRVTGASGSVVPAKQGMSFCRSVCNHTEYQAGLASKPAEWPWNWDGTQWLKRGSWRTRLLEEQRGVQGELLENLWCSGLAAERVHVCKRQCGTNGWKSSRAEQVPKPSNRKDL